MNEKNMKKKNNKQETVLESREIGSFVTLKFILSILSQEIGLRHHQLEEKIVELRMKEFLKYDIWREWKNWVNIRTLPKNLKNWSIVEYEGDNRIHNYWRTWNIPQRHLWKDRKNWNYSEKRITEIGKNNDSTWLS